MEDTDLEQLMQDAMRAEELFSLDELEAHAKRLQCKHEYVEGYYGWKCRHCDMFFAYGGAPWDYDFETERPLSHAEEYEE